MDVGDCVIFDTCLDEERAWIKDGGFSGGSISLQYSQNAMSCSGILFWYVCQMHANIASWQGLDLQFLLLPPHGHVWVQVAFLP